MKILLNLITILLIFLIMFMLAQNADQYVNVRLLTFDFASVNLVIVIIISLTLGAMFGAVFMAFNAIQARTEVRRIQRQNKTLTAELEKLRNVSIDEIPEPSLLSDAKKEESE